jgi:hypothetical protein
VVATLVLAASAATAVLLEHAATAATAATTTLEAAASSEATTTAASATAEAASTTPAFATRTEATASTSAATATAAFTPRAEAATTSATAAAAAEATAATTTTFLTRSSLVDGEGTTAEVLTVDGLNGGATLVVIHLDETEAAGTTGLSIGHEMNAMHGAVRGEQLREVVLGGRERKVPDVDADHDWRNPKGRPERMGSVGANARVTRHRPATPEWQHRPRNGTSRPSKSIR